jgi:puromycin-sensitive aminopeptidase
MEYVFVGANYPEFGIWPKFLHFEMEPAFSIDSRRNSHPIEVPIKSPKELDEIYDSVTYEKSNSVIRMLFEHLGEKTFRAGLQIYLKRHQYGNAVTTDLWKALSEASGQVCEYEI